MNCMPKRIVSWLMCLVLVTGLVPAPAFAQAGDALPLVAPVRDLAARAAAQTVVFADSVLADAVTGQLDSKGVTYAKDDDHTITLDISQVTELDLSNKYLASVGGLGDFAYLTSLDLSNNDIKDYAPLASLTSLVSLKANDNRATSVDALCSMVNLEHLELATNDLVDAAAMSENSFASKLSALSRLKHLDLSHNFIRYTNGLGALAHLEYLDLYDNGVHDLGGLADPEGLADGAPRLSTSLKHLDLGQNNEQTAVEMGALRTSPRSPTSSTSTSPRTRRLPSWTISAA